MITRIKNSLVFRLERLMMRGPLAYFGFILLLIALIALGAGIVIHQLDPEFDSLGDAVWWAFEHLIVPEFIDGDEGVIKRTFAVPLIVLGSIMFAGAVIAVLVQWLDETREHLQLGLTPVVLDAHVVLLGWSSRTSAILAEIMASQGRIERFLRERGGRSFHVALLAEPAAAALTQQLRLQLGEHWNARQIILRSGSPLILDELARVDFAHASVIVVPAADTSAGSALDADTRTVKTLLTLGAALEETSPEKPPLVLAELQDPRHTRTLRALYRGPMEIIAGDEVIARLMVQTVRRPGLSHVYAEFLTDVGGCQIYVREESHLVGASVQQLTHAFPKAVLLGVVRPQGDSFKALLNPPNDLPLEAGDRIAVLASSHKDAVPPDSPGDWDVISEKPAPEPRLPAHRRVLVLGWNHRVPALLAEFASYSEEEFSIDIVSEVPANKREKRIGAEVFSREKLQIRQLEFDYTISAYLEDIDPAGYDNVVLLASERLKPGAQSDARTILGFLLLHELMSGRSPAPRVLVELTDPDNVTLFQNRSDEIIVSPVIVSHMLARVALRRELRAVFDELFTSGGSEIFFRRISDYGSAEILSEIPDTNTSGGDYTFSVLQRLAGARGEIAIGIRRAGQERMPHGGVELNPVCDEHLRLSENDELIVLATDH